MKDLATEPDAIAGDGPPGGPRLRVAVYLLPEFTLTPVATFLDTLRLAADEGDRSRPLQCSWQLLSDDPGRVRSSCGLSLGPSERPCRAEPFDCLVVAGGRTPVDFDWPPGGADLVRAALARNRTVIGLCRASYAMAGLGVLAGRRACVHWLHRGEFLDAFPDVEPVSDAVYVRDGNFITCAGGLGAVRVANWLVEHRVGLDTAVKAARIMLFDRLVDHGEAQPAAPLFGPARHRALRTALAHIEAHFSEALDVDDLAARGGVSRRQLERLFRRELGITVAQALRSYRLAVARNLIAHSDARILDIAIECGFASEPHFATLFRQHYGHTPRAYRAVRGEAVGDHPSI